MSSSGNEVVDGNSYDGDDDVMVVKNKKELLFAMCDGLNQDADSVDDKHKV